MPSPRAYNPPREETPLLESEGIPDKDVHDPGPLRRVFFTSFLLSMTFAITQAWYDDGHTYDGIGDRCSQPSINAQAAKDIALMSTITTSSTIFNLFLTGFWIKRYGCKAALAQQTSWAAMRNLCQIYALSVGGRKGIFIIQVTQLFNVMGSGGGYLLASNAFVAALSPSEKRTSGFGILQGVVMLGASIGYTTGGLTERSFGRLAPFQTAFVLLVFCTIFSFFFLPYVDHLNDENGIPKKKGSVLAPLRLFLPTTTIIAGKVQRNYSIFLLGAGTFFSVLATGYVPMALQLVGQNVFGFLPAQNGFMLVIFLSIVFPWLIDRGRAYMSSSPSIIHSLPAEEHPEDESHALDPNVIGAINYDQAREPTDDKHGSAFDLVFLQWSIFLDGILTGGVTASTRGWHLYLAGVILPFASGTGPAAKGVTLDLVSAEDRDDALAAIALIERIAQVSTTGLFGYVFACLSGLGEPTFVFLANTLVAMLGFALLLFVKMPTISRTSRLSV